MIQNWDQLLIPYDQAVEELKIKFKSIRNEYRRMDEYSPIEFVTGRVKKISSILDKAKKLDIPLDKLTEQMEDIAGIRIMCQMVEDIDRVVDLIRERDGKDLKVAYEKDYIKNKKESGYRSYHMIIKYPVHTAFGEKEILAEIQIRTLAMNFWSTIEHSLNYKFERNIPKHIRVRLKNAAEAASKLDQEMSEIREEIIDSQEVFQVKSSLVADILNKIQTLYFSGKIKDIDDYREEFFRIQERGDFAELREFKKRLDELAKKYNIQMIL
ncbi:GTP pyrophosphokinase family protein [Clostridium sp. D2Q-11]|uniref:GTP pyrophosphokinase family protein n=1 Tax=Anaeromonas frigoriresistens TaxID=2683708 RepID=A0A942Z882_9FIRM|nr:GTP pyrophosphokinase family protein [Anaeromonas frigoriresistens]MBS4537699.1 GTP pyrophosphokinase family protein [Anaeromonas frigoriresistens]